MNPFSSNKFENDKLYISRMAPLFIKGALFSDTTENYVSPAEPNPYARVKIRLRTAQNNIDAAYLCAYDEYYPMTKVESNRAFDFYETEVTLSDGPFLYHFVVKAGSIICLYDAGGVEKGDASIHPFRIIPGFQTPNWAKGAVMYQIYTERFNNGDKSNDVENNEYFYVGGHVKKVDDWYKVPNVDGTKEFYGGDLQGVIDKLDYLEDLGIECIYFNPLFVSPSNHKYDSQDYEHIDPHFGKIVVDGGNCLEEGDKDNRNATKYQTRVCTKENLEASDALFCHLVEEAHKRGIKVILDGVFNHCGSFNKWLDRERIYEGHDGFENGAYISKDSPYNSYFDFRGSDNWPYNGNYDGWWGYDTLPKLNYEASSKLYDKIIEIGRKWVSPPFNVDGWRLDVAADLGHSADFNHEFFKRFRREVKEVNPDAIILAEHYGNPEFWLNGREWDSVMNYDGFMEPVTWFLTGMQKHSDDFRFDLLGNADAFFGAMKDAEYKLPTPALSVAMNELSNHDHSRFLTRTNQKVGRVNYLGAQAADEGVNKAVMRQAVCIQMTWLGAPTIYYGDEAGLTGFTDPDNRRTYPWGREDHELIDFHKEMIKIHKEHDEIKTGSTIKLIGEHNLISYARFSHKDATIVIINRANEEKEVKLPFWQAVSGKGVVFERIMMSTPDGYDTTKEFYETKQGNIELKLPPVSAIVICTRKEDQVGQKEEVTN